MVKKCNKQLKVKDKHKSNGKSVLDKINADDASAILKVLSKENPKVARRIEQIAMEYLSRVDIEGVASQVYSALDGIRAEEVWDRSGNTQYGYVEPGDMAWQMFEETLEPYMEELKKYKKLLMHEEVKKYCMGILKGIYQFEKESKSKYKEWAEDAPGEYVGMILDEWKKGCKNKKDKKEMDEFIEKNFQDWYKR